MEQKQLIKIIKDNIIKKQQKILESNKILIEEFDSLINQITSDITQVNIDLLKKYLEYINKDKVDYDVNKDIKIFQAIQLIKANNPNLSNMYKLTQEQENYLQSIINNLNRQKNIEISKKEDNQKLSMQIEYISSNLLNTILNKNDYIQDIETINQILEEEQIDYETRYNILVYILKRNKDLFLSKRMVEQKINSPQSEEITPNKEEQLKELFSKYAYEFSKIDTEFRQQFIQNGDLQNIEEMIKILIPYRNYVKETDSCLSLLLLYSNKEIFKQIKNIAENNSIRMKEMFKYPSIFIQNVSRDNNDKKEIDVHSPIPSYDIFMNNVNEIKKLKFNFGEIFESMPLEIVGPNKKILSNLKLTREYNLPPSSRSIKKSYSYSALKKTDTFKKIDQYIELGLYDYIKVNLSINSSPTRIAEIMYVLKNRRDVFEEEERRDVGIVKILKENVLKDFPREAIINIQNSWIDCSANIPNAKQYSKILKNNRNDEIDELLVLKNLIIRKLEENITRDRMAYNIGGILISRIKVLRIFTTLAQNGYDDEEALLYAMTYNSLLTKEQYEMVQSIFSYNNKKGGRG